MRQMVAATWLALIALGGSALPSYAGSASTAAGVGVTGQAADGVIYFDSQSAAARAAPHQFAKSIAYSVSPLTAGSWGMMDGLLLWQYSIDIIGAHSVSLSASRVRVPKGGALFVNGVDQSTRITRRNQLWSSIAEGERLDIEAWIPADRLGEFVLDIDKLQAGFRKAGKAYAKAADSDAYNAACFLPELDRHSRATLNITVDNVGLCSAVLVNNTRKDQRPFVLTASHCGVSDPDTISGAPDYSNIDKYDWDAAAASIQVRGDSITPCGEPIVSRGRPLIAAGAVSRVVNGDMWLVEMDAPLPGPMRRFFAGVDARTSDSSTPHPVPVAELSSVSHSQGFPQVVARFERVFTEGCVAAGIDCWITFVSDETLPAAQGGSSGSALFDSNARVSGTVFGGLNNRHTYQQVASSWNVAAKRNIARFLAPDATPGQAPLVIGGFDPPVPTATPSPTPTPTATPTAVPTEAPSSGGGGSMNVAGILLLMVFGLVRRRIHRS